MGDPLNLPSPAHFFRSGELCSIRMMLFFYNAVIDIEPTPARPDDEFIHVRVGQGHFGVPSVGVTFSFNTRTALDLVHHLRTGRAVKLQTLPVDEPLGHAVEQHARHGGMRAFVAVFGKTGRHLLDAALWASDENHLPERPDLTFALAKFWILGAQNGMHRKEDDRQSWARPSLEQWNCARNDLPLDPEVDREFQRFTPYPE